MLFTRGDIFSHPQQSEQENYSNWIFKQPVNKYFWTYWLLPLSNTQIVTVAEFSNCFARDKYSVGLTAESNKGKKTDMSLGTFGAVMDVNVLPQGRE